MLKPHQSSLTNSRLQGTSQHIFWPRLRTSVVAAPLAVTLTMTVILLSGCNTPQQKAENSPPPIPPPAQPSSQPSSDNPDTSGAEQQGDQQAEQGESAPPPPSQSDDTSSQALAEAATKPPEACEEKPTPSSPDVQITDVPLDKYGNPIEPEPTALADNNRAQEDCKTAKNSSEAQKTQQQTNAEKQAEAQKAASGAMTQKAQTGEEKLAAANASLDARLAAFDEAMRRAREAAEQQQRQDAAGGSSGGMGGEFAGRGGNPNMPEGARGEGGQADTASGLGHTPDQSGETRPGDYRPVATGPVPTNIPDGRDDDIVARQLREAASKESDPVLRDKLWEEYKKYKTGITGR